MSNILIAEDNSTQLDALALLLSEYNPTWNIFKAATYHEAIRIMKENHIHLFLLDMELNKNIPLENGVELGKIIRSNSQYTYTPILFITVFPEKIQDALNETHCYHYLLKPYKPESLYKVLDSVTASPLMKETFIQFKDRNGIYVKLKKQDILYVTSEKRQLFFHTIHSVFHSVGLTFEGATQKLGNSFCRCHRKYLVNLNYIDDYDKTTRLISIQKHHIPVGRTYKEKFEKQFNFH